MLALGSPQQRALLAVLLVHRGEPVSSDRLVDALWGERAPASAVKIVQGYVSNLRKMLGDGLLVTRGRGYLLQAETGQLDLGRFESLVEEGRRALQEGDARSAAARLREALRAVAWSPAGRLRLRVVRAGRDRKSGGGSLGGVGGPDRRRSRARPSGAAGRRAGGARPRASRARALSGSADAGAVPVRSSGRSRWPCTATRGERSWASWVSSRGDRCRSLSRRS